MADPSAESGLNDQLLDAFTSIGRQAIENDGVGAEGFYQILRTALNNLCEKFLGAYTLSRPYIMWEILSHIEEDLANLYGIPIWATTSLPQPSYSEHPIAGRALDSLKEIIEFSTVDTMFHNIKEWCKTGRVVELGIEDHEPYEPQDPEPAGPTEAEDKKPAKSAGGQKKQQQQQKKPAELARGQKRKKPAEPMRGQDKKPAQSETSPEPTAPTRGQLAAPSGGRRTGLGSRFVPEPGDSQEEEELQLALQLSRQEAEERRTASGGRLTELAPQPSDADRLEEEYEFQMALQLSLREYEPVPSSRQSSAAPAGRRSTRPAPQQLPYSDWRPDPRQTPVPTGFVPRQEQGLVSRRSRARTPTGYTPPPESREQRDDSPQPEETHQMKKRRLD